MNSVSAPKYIVYGLFDPETGELRYVGKSTFGWKRVARHWAPSCLANPRNRARSKAWCKSVLARGLIPVGQVLETCSSAEEVGDREVFWIAEYRARGADLVNHDAGGRGGRHGPRSEEERAAMSRRMMGNRYTAGKPRNLSPEQREAMAERARRRSADPAIQAKISATLTGRKNGPHSAETRAKISKALMGHPPYPGAGRPRKVK